MEVLNKSAFPYLYFGCYLIRPEKWHNTLFDEYET